MADDDGGAMGTTSSSQSLPPMGSGLERTTTSSGLRRTLTDARPGGAGAPTFARPPRAPPSGAELVSTVSNVHRKTLAAEIPFGAVIDFTNHAVGLASARAPWKAGSRNTYTGTGFYIGDKKIITNHHVIKGQTSLRLKRNGQAGNFAGRLLCRSRLCDLALVTVDDDAFWEGLPEVELQDALPELDDTVVVVGYPASSGAGAKSVTVTRGVVSNLQLLDLSLESNNPHQLTIQIDAAINSGNSGGPVFNTDTCAVVGVAFASQREGRGGGGKIIPVAVLRNFLKVFDKTGAEEFGLLPEPGFGFDQLVNPTLRKSCFGGTLPKHRNGCLINKVSDKGCADGKLLVGDILMAIDGVAVSEDGDVVLRGQELLDFEYMFTKKTMGETVQVTVLREAGSPAEPGPQQSASGVAINFAQQSQPRQELTVELTLSPNRIGPPVGVDYTYLYATLGGLVFIAWTLPEWVQSARTETDKKKQKVQLASVLAHPMNVSFDQYIGEYVDKVNGVAVKSLRHFATLVAGIADGLITIDFKPPRVERKGKMVPDGSRTYVVLDAAAVKACEAEILEADKIPTWCSPELLDPPDEPEPESEPEPEPEPEPELEPEPE